MLKGFKDSWYQFPILPSAKQMELPVATSQVLLVWVFIFFLFITGKEIYLSKPKSFTFSL
jgi:hypothetical protein